jgi:uncharacterized protein (DUF433 family)
MSFSGQNSSVLIRKEYGVFLAKDVSEILKLPYSSVRYWMFEFWDGRFSKGRDALYTFGEKGNKAINFLTLIEFYTFYHLRKKGVSSQRIQKAHHHIAEQLDTKYPFALAGISTDGKKIWYEYLENMINADGSGQIDMKKIIEPFLDKIDFGDNYHAERYYPLGKSHNVVVDPQHQFGQPTLPGTNLKTDTIFKLFKGGETKKNICILYDISQKQVSDAILYYQNRRA